MVLRAGAAETETRMAWQGVYGRTWSGRFRAGHLVHVSFVHDIVLGVVLVHQVPQRHRLARRVGLEHQHVQHDVVAWFRFGGSESVSDFFPLFKNTGSMQCRACYVCSAVEIFTF